MNLVIGKIYQCRQFSPLHNRYETIDVKLIDYIRRHGQRDVVKVSFQGRIKTIAVNVFKSKIV